jgi:hypothetical protein
MIALLSNRKLRTTQTLKKPPAKTNVPANELRQKMQTAKDNDQPDEARQRKETGCHDAAERRCRSDPELPERQAE